jgi:carboxypeptidase D
MAFVSIPTNCRKVEWRSWLQFSQWTLDREWSFLVARGNSRTCSQLLQLDQPVSLIPSLYPATRTNTTRTNVIWIEQPVGVGYSKGKPNITNEVELGHQFTGFWKNFIDTFDLKGATTYITGESYGGFYVPYIADAFITANDDDYYKLGGVAINDPLIGDATLQQQAVIFPYIEYWQNLFNLNQTYMNALRWTHQHCGYEKYLKKYGTFPPPEEKFPVLPDPYADTNPKSNYTCDIFDFAYAAALDQNPCFNIYHITDTCPHLYGQLGIVNQVSSLIQSF